MPPKRSLLLILLFSASLFAATSANQTDKNVLCPPSYAFLSGAISKDADTSLPTLLRWLYVEQSAISENQLTLWVETGKGLIEAVNGSHLDRFQKQAIAVILTRSDIAKNTEARKKLAGSVLNWTEVRNSQIEKRNESKDETRFVVDPIPITDLLEIDPVSDAFFGAESSPVFRYRRNTIVVESLSPEKYFHSQSWIRSVRGDQVDLEGWVPSRQFGLHSLLKTDFFIDARVIETASDKYLALVWRNNSDTLTRFGIASEKSGSFIFQKSFDSEIESSHEPFTVESKIEGHFRSFTVSGNRGIATINTGNRINVISFDLSRKRADFIETEPKSIASRAVVLPDQSVGVGVLNFKPTSKNSKHPGRLRSIYTASMSLQIPQKGINVELGSFGTGETKDTKTYLLTTPKSHYVLSSINRGKENYIFGYRVTQSQLKSKTKSVRATEVEIKLPKDFKGVDNLKIFQFRGEDYLVAVKGNTVLLVDPKSQSPMIRTFTLGTSNIDIVLEAMSIQKTTDGRILAKFLTSEDQDWEQYGQTFQLVGSPNAANKKKK